MSRAAEYRHLDIVDTLIDAGASVNTVDVFGWTPIYQAAICGHSNVIRHLLDRGASPNGNDLCCPLHAILITSQTTTGTIRKNKSALKRVMGVLHYTGVDYYMRRVRASNSFVHEFATSHQSTLTAAEIVELLIDRGCSVRLRDPDGASALQLAAETGQADIIRMLVLAGADVSNEPWLTHQCWPSGMSYDDDVYEWLYQLAVGRVQSLVSLCRVTIRGRLHSHIDEKINLLPVPSKLQNLLRIKCVLQ